MLTRRRKELLTGPIEQFRHKAARDVRMESNVFNADRKWNVAANYF